MVHEKCLFRYLDVSELFSILREYWHLQTKGLFWAYRCCMSIDFWHSVEYLVFYQHRSQCLVCFLSPFRG